MATNDELRAAVYLLKQAAMEELPDGYTITLVAGKYGINLTTECQTDGGTTLGQHGDRWRSAISAAKADAKRRGEQ